jgi:hypothetical protein
LCWFGSVGVGKCGMRPGSGDVEMACGIADRMLVERCCQSLEFRTADVIEFHLHQTALLVFGCMVLPFKEALRGLLLNIRSSPMDALRGLRRVCLVGKLNFWPCELLAPKECP